MDLAESLEQFHITSPERKTKIGGREIQDKENGTNDRNNERVGLKAYKANDESLPRQFGSFMSKMDDWSVDYGTVRAANGKVSVNKLKEKEEKVNESQAQWRQYLIPPHHSNQGRQEDTSDLIVTASLSDLSLIPADTFKRKDKREVSSISQETDPAREAKSVFNNVLRHQQSNYFKDTVILDGKPELTNGPKLAYQSQDSDSESSESGSVINGSDINSPSPKPRGIPGTGNSGSNKLDGNNKRLPLITPEDAGLVFNHETGLWDKQKISETKLSGATISNATIESFKSDESCGKSQLSISEIENSEVGNHINDNYMKASGLNGISTEERPSTKMSDNMDTATSSNLSISLIDDDTPLSTPKINTKFLPINQKERVRNLSSLGNEFDRAEAETSSVIDDITNISRMETSYDLTKGELVSKLLEAEPDPNNWQRLTSLNLSGQSIRDSCIGLSELTPDLVQLDLSQNELISLQGIPKNLHFLRVSNNKLRPQLLQFRDLSHLEHLDISHNNLSSLHDLRFISSLQHLHHLDITHCSLTSLAGLPSNTAMNTIIARDNRIIGLLDFKPLVDAAPYPWTHVTKLDLSNNKITNIKNLHLLSSLRVLILDGNAIEYIHDETGASPLRTLSIRNATLPLFSLQGFLRLRILRITVPTGTTTSATSLASAYNFPFGLEDLEIIGIHSKTQNGPSASQSATNRFHVGDGNGYTWQHVVFPPLLRSVTLRSLQLLSVPSSLSINTSLVALDLQGNDIVSAQLLLPSLPPHLLRLKLQGNPLVDPHPLSKSKSAHCAGRFETSSNANSANLRQLSSMQPLRSIIDHQETSRQQTLDQSNRTLLRLLLHCCPALVESDLLEG